MTLIAEQPLANAFRRSLPRLCRAWILLTFIFAALGCAIAAVLVPFTLGASLLLVGLFACTLAAIAQARLLEIYAPQIDWSHWKSLSFLGSLLASLAFALLLIAFQVFDPDDKPDDLKRIFWVLAATGTAGAVYGAVQWLALRGYVSSAWHWVWANVAGALVGVAVGWAVATLIYEGLIPSDLKGAYVTGLGEALWAVIAVSIATGLMSLVTGLVMAWLLGRSPGILSCFVEQSS